MRHALVAALEDAADLFHAAATSDAMRALSRREHFDAEEALASVTAPEPSTWDDVELAAVGDKQTIRSMRTALDAGRGKWLTAVVGRRAACIAEREARWSAFVALPEHQAWLRDGGPARLWDRLAASKRDASGSGAITELEQWRMDEMVRLYLKEDSQ
jgi:hypothetical protein